MELTGWDVDEQVVGAESVSGCGGRGVMGYKDGSWSKFWEHREGLGSPASLVTAMGTAETVTVPHVSRAPGSCHRAFLSIVLFML